MNFMAAVAPQTGASIPPIPIPQIDPFDMLPIESRLAKTTEEMERMTLLAEQLQVVDEDSQKRAIEMAGQAKGLFKRVEDMRKETVGPHNEFVKKVNGLCKTITDPLQRIEDRVKVKITQFAAKQEQKRREREAAERREREELQKKLDAEAAASNTVPVKVADPVQPKAPTQRAIHTAEGSAHQRKEWRFEVEDTSKVPTQYLIVDHAAIRKAVAAGVREIPGVRIYEETTTVIKR